MLSATAPSPNGGATKASRMETRAIVPAACSRNADGDGNEDHGDDDEQDGTIKERTGLIHITPQAVQGLLRAAAHHPGRQERLL
jgi:hypothetical protein